jgi:hypothetical protein
MAARPAGTDRKSQYCFLETVSMVVLHCNEKRNQYGSIKRTREREMTVNYQSLVKASSLQRDGVRVKEETY